MPTAIQFREVSVRTPQGRLLLDSYHCSRYNTNTRRLTPAMFREVFDAIAMHLGRRGVRAAA